MDNSRGDRYMGQTQAPVPTTICCIFFSHRGFCFFLVAVERVEPSTVIHVLLVSCLTLRLVHACLHDEGLHEFPLSAICLRGCVLAFLHLQADAEHFTHQ